MKGEDSFETIDTFVSGCFVDNEIKIDTSKDQEHQTTSDISAIRPLTDEEISK